MMQLLDNVPVLRLPGGLRALADTGCNGVDIVTNREMAPLSINGTIVHPTVAPVDLPGIARGIGAPTLDMLIGANVLHGGFTADLRHGTFAFSARGPLADEETVAVLPYTRPESGIMTSPVVIVEIGGETVTGIFDTGAPYTLWKRRCEEPDRPAQTTREDFHVALTGQLVQFPVLSRPESVRIGDVTIDLDVAYIPETWPATAFHPDTVIGMDVPAALGASSFVLDPGTMEIRFYRPRRVTA